MPTAITSSSPAASTSVQATFTHIASLMPRRTSPVRMSRKPMAMDQTGSMAVPTTEARLTAKTCDCVAIEVRPEATTESPTMKLRSGMPKARSTTKAAPPARG